LSEEQQSEHGQTERGTKRPTEKDHFGRAREQKGRVKRFHPTEVSASELGPTSSSHPSCISTAEKELDQTLECQQGQ
jgi:hypothetical protein